MLRREVLTLIGGTVAAWPFVAGAQQKAMPVIGYLSPGSPESDVFRLAGFTVGDRARTIDYRNWRPIWFVVRWA